MTYKVLLLSFISLLFIACGSGGGDGNDDFTASQKYEKVFSTDAFNSRDSSTFAASTCNVPALSAPVGIFAAANGSPTGVGTQNDPLDLKTALGTSSPVQPGETLWLAQGMYEGEFISYLSGSNALPIEVRPFPGAQVVIVTDSQSGAALSIRGAYTHYYGLEVLSSSTKRESQQRSSGPTDLHTASGISISGADNIKLINCIVHDNVGGGIDAWSNSYETELYGNIIYNNGWTAPDRGHGHAIYAQNNAGTGVKTFRNNTIFFGFGTGIHIYTEGGQISDFTLLENTWFITGASSPRSDQRKDNCLVGGYKPVTNLIMNNNQGFQLNNRGTRLGYGGSVIGQSATLNNNYLSENLWVAGSWNTLTIDSTTVHRGLTGDADTYITDGVSGNTVLTSPPSSGKKIFVQPNAYDPNRAKIVIYNFDESAHVTVNNTELNGFLKNGEAYRVHSVYDLFSEPLLEGVYSGSGIIIPMGTVELPQPRGLDGIGPEDDPGRKFGTFIITRAGC